MYNGGTLNGGTLGHNQTTVLDDQPINFTMDTNGRPINDGHYGGDFLQGGVEVSFRGGGGGGTLGGGSVNGAFQGSNGNISAGYRTAQSQRANGRHEQNYFGDMDL